ncbi:hypothetical protein HKBW3S06_00542 [Candidatus Hakubella thermalkaliphila]|uniref:Uncharacterized protein n=1 Tax=Candidatus Hakubella thermalkaliphila TaxID=2754717 RepID=A0A6V8NS99_9ACTN|nr:hypothetical protein HKBW3S06_00542 [Candidatus Hakubella thermalkaliphila]
MTLYLRLVGAYINPTAILKNLGSICRAISLIEPQHIVCIQVNDVVGLIYWGICLTPLDAKYSVMNNCNAQDIVLSGVM